MSAINTGGAAFPILSDVRPDIDHAWCGMTLRDYFAAKAMQCMMAGRSDGVAAFPIEWANASYTIADAMIEARVKNNTA